MADSARWRSSIVNQAVGMVAAMGIAVTFSAVRGASADSLMLLTASMIGSGLISLIIGYTLYQRRTIRLMRSLHLSLMVNTVLILVIVSVNVLVIAFSMLIAEGDTLVIASLLIFAAIVAILLGSLHARLIVHELATVRHALDQLGRADLDGRLPLFGNDELANLAETFNRMADRLREADRQKEQAEQLRRDLIAWVSHDLRTPLTSLRVMNEALMDGVVAEPAQSAAYLHDMNREILTLGQMIDDMFELSLMDAGGSALRLEQVSLLDILSDMHGSLLARAARQHMRLEVDLRDQATAPVWIAPDKIRRVLNNLIDNAFQYGEPGGLIRITARCEADRVRVSVFNSGAAIPQADLAHLFEPFYRADKARRDNHDRYRHAGLGLAIARQFIEAHGGTIGVTSEVNAGTTIWFCLPIHTGGGGVMVHAPA